MHFVLWGLHQQRTVVPFLGIRRVSMHFVLWGLHQHGFSEEPYLEEGFNALRALGSSSTRIYNANAADYKFQCTSCFGVFINNSYERKSRTTVVSMHFVLWGLHQLLSEFCLKRQECFNALRALGSSSTGIRRIE